MKGGGNALLASKAIKALCTSEVIIAVDMKILGCDAKLFSRWVQIFQRTALPSSSGKKIQRFL
jgi:hypothetical protein